MTSKRDIAAANETALLAQVVKMVYFVRMDFSSGVQRMHTEIGPKTATHPIHGAEVYTGIGDFGGITSAVIESVSKAPQTLQLSLTGVKASLITTALTDDYFRRDVEVMLGLEDTAGDLISDPEILFSGFMDTVNLTLDKDLGAMTLVCESRGTNFQRASDHRFSDEDKQVEVNGDLFAEYAYRMIDLQLRWGDTNFRPPFSPPRPPNPNLDPPDTIIAE